MIRMNYINISAHIVDRKNSCEDYQPNEEVAIVLENRQKYANRVVIEMKFITQT